ncbi:protocatechuate 3,4-dioxygenase subunit alpha [Elioraea thermophila]|uniref:protocatechuate 3,4-dioxygenase subunit alpha n=1 Tax=Elioraea thermophila TaxID=2185104 RepID=UPI000DF12608|nr:protocatechuate 3,4-dioxygenase subunit alpha [Elioraea thermophila]
MARANRLGQTPTQTVGPYFAIGLAPHRIGLPFLPLATEEIATDEAEGEPLVLMGRVLDGDGAPVSDALIEARQRDARGGWEPGRGFRGYGRAATDRDGCFRFRTVRPGVAAGDEAPHLWLIVQARGLLGPLVTRVHFADEAERNARDPILLAVPPARRATLLADKLAPGRYRFDIRLQGENETVFFDL